ncbi:24399_t:CDS:2, partial [Racocetra persica]
NSTKRKHKQNEKENLPKKKSKSTITLFCMLKDDSPSSAFPIEIEDSDVDGFANLTLNDRDIFLLTSNLSKYFTKAPAKEHIHVIVSLTKNNNREQELRDQLTELQKKI